jgi:hypothetical protein
MVMQVIELLDFPAKPTSIKDFTIGSSQSHRLSPPRL